MAGVRSGARHPLLHHGRPFDHFKQFNDPLWPPVGDLVIKAVAKTLSHALQHRRCAVPLWRRRCSAVCLTNGRSCKPT